MEETRQLLRHLVATLAHRAGLCLRDAPAGFGDFSAGAGVRTPAELVRHLSDLMSFTQGILTGGALREAPARDWEGEIEGFRAALRELDAALASAAQWRNDPRIALQGPLSDALTHVGQLALLRRLAGSPITSGHYPTAPIRAGRVGLD